MTRAIPRSEVELARWHGRTLARCRRIGERCAKHEPGSPGANHQARRLLDAGTELVAVERLMRMEPVERLALSDRELAELQAGISDREVWARLSPRLGSRVELPTGVRTG